MKNQEASSKKTNLAVEKSVGESERNNHGCIVDKLESIIFPEIQELNKLDDYKMTMMIGFVGRCRST